MSDCGCPDSSTNPCAQCPPSTVDNESLPSVVENFIFHFFGSLTKTLDSDGNVVWTLPCDLATGVTGNPRLEGEGLACYFKRLFESGVVGLSGKNAFATSTADFVQPDINSSVEVFLDNIEPFSVDQYVWGSTAGFYKVQEVRESSLILKNLFGPPDSLSAGNTVSAGAKFSASGVPETSGPPGAPGTDGHDGTSQYIRIGYADDGNGSGFTLVPNASKSFVAFLVTTTPTTTPTVSDFAGLWVQYKGADGAAGTPGTEPQRVWQFDANGTHYWTCPLDVTQVRIRLYGAGGGGGGGASTANGGGNGFGAGGGEYAEKFQAVTPQTTYRATVGAGGGGGTGGDASANGSNGGDSSFSDSFTTFLVAKGGVAGSAAIAPGGAPGAGGTGGSGTASLRLAGWVGGTPAWASTGGAIDPSYGGMAGRLGAGGLGGGAGGSPGGGGGGGLGDAGGPGAAGLAGANGRVVIEVQ